MATLAIENTKIAGNQKHSAVCKFCTNPLIIPERKEITSAFVRLRLLQLSGVLAPAV